MLYPLQFIIDALYPPTEHELLLRSITPSSFTQWYHPRFIEGTTVLSEYTLPQIQAAISACKFEHSYHAARLLTTLIATHLQNLPSQSTVLIPLPLSRRRFRERGFNQVERVLTQLPKLPYPCTMVNNLLIRSIHTKPQTSLTRIERLKNMQSAFTINTSALHKLDTIERVIICDDVLTTGATMTAAKKALKDALPSHIILMTITWAH